MNHFYRAEFVWVKVFGVGARSIFLPRTLPGEGIIGEKVSTEKSGQKMRTRVKIDL